MRSVPRTSPLCGFLIAGLLGCAPGGCHPTPNATTPGRDAADEGEAAEAPGRPRAETPAEPTALPVLNREALSARVQAQRNLLGASALFEDERGKPVPWLSPQVEPVEGEQKIDDDLLTSLPGSSGLGDGKQHTGARVNGNALGLYEPIEGDGADAVALEAFHEALRRLREGKDPDGKVRVLLYGASHTDADVYPQYVRAYLQERFGDGGHGYVHIARPWKWYRHLDVSVEGFERWFTDHAQRREGSQDGLYGLLGASLSTRSKKAFGRVTLKDGVVASSFELYFLQQPRGGSFKVLLDGKTIATVKTRAADFDAGYHTFTAAEETEHVVEVRPVGDGEVRLFGLIAERSGPGVVVDTLGIGGTRAQNMLTWDETVWGDNVRRRDPDLVVLFYGTNESTFSNVPMSSYEADLRAVLEKLKRVAPQASCLLMGPGDFPIPNGDGTFMPRPRISEIVDAQSRIAPEFGCGFWDTQAFMGGVLSMTQWVNADPPMAKPDHIHFTRRGYVRIGMAIADALMANYDGAGAIKLDPKAER